MLPDSLRTAACKFSLWLGDRLGVPAICPMPLSDIPGQIEAFLQSRQAMAMICALALVVVIHGMRTLWWNGQGRWDRR